MRVLPIIFMAELKSLFRNRSSVFWILLFPAILFVILLVATNDRVAATVLIAVDDAVVDAGDLVEQIRRAAVESHVDGYFPVTTAGAATAPPGILVTAPGCAGPPADGGPACALEVQTLLGGGPLAAQAALIATGLVKDALDGDWPGGARQRVTLVRPEGSEADLTTGQYLLSGVIVLALISAGINATSGALVAARERHVFASMARFPLPIGNYVAVMVIARVVAGVMAVMTLFLLGVVAFGVEWSGGVATIAFVVLLATIAASFFSLLGLTLASLFDTESAVTFAGNLVYLPLLFLGDLTFPGLGAGDGLIGTLIAGNPATVFVDWLRQGLFAGRYLALGAVPAASLALFAAVLLLAATRVVRRV